MIRLPSYQWYRLHFPSLVEPEQFSALLHVLHGLSSPGRQPLAIFQAVGRRGGVEHHVRLPEARSAALLAHAGNTVPGLLLQPIDRVDVGQPQAAWRLWASSSRRPLRVDDPAAVSQAVLTALASVHGDEVLVMQWLLGPVRRPVVVPTRHSPLLSESWPRALATAALVPPGDVDAEARSALRRKQGEPGWRIVGRIAVQAASQERGRGLLGQVLGALRTAEGPGATLGIRPIRPAAVTAVQTPCFWGLALNVSELTALMAWPLGDLALPPVAQRRARLLPVPPTVPRHGRILAVEPTTERPIALTASDSRHHLWVLGPTGTGKSTLLLNLIG
jgi:hypothetical protein